MTYIRPERPGDEAPIHALVAACFPTDAEARLIDALRAIGRLTLSLVARDSKAAAGGLGVAGHVAFSPVTADGAPGGLGLAPLAVDAPHRRRGIGAALVREGLNLCAQVGCPYVVVLGDPAYYGRFGFVPASRWGLWAEIPAGEAAPARIIDDAFQIVALAPNGLPPKGSAIRFAPEFAGV